MPRPQQHILLWALVLAVFDALCIVGAFFLATNVLDRDPSERDSYLAIFVAVWCLQAIDQRLFVSRRGDSLIPQLLMLTKSVVGSLILSNFIMIIWLTTAFDRIFALAFSGLILLLLVALRTTMRLGLSGLLRRGYNYRRILFIGANARAAQASEVILSNEYYGFEIIGYLDDDASRNSFLERYNVPYFGKIDDLEKYLIDGVIDVVYISLPVRSCYERIQSITHLCEGVGVPVRLIADLFPLRIATTELTRIADIPLLALTAPDDTHSRELLQRGTDFLVSSLLLVILAPILAIIAVLIKLESRGPVLAREARLSHHARKPFNLLHFRTKRLPDGDRSDAQTETSDAAARHRSFSRPLTTTFGGFLLRYSLVDLPELINIWKGDMSLSEPRPETAPESAPSDSP